MPASLPKRWTEAELDRAETRTNLAVWPIMALVEGKYWEYTQHGPQHVEKVKRLSMQLAHLYQLDAHEQRLLRYAALTHDLGLVDNRETHERSPVLAQLIDNNKVEIPLFLVDTLIQINKAHRAIHDYDPNLVKILDDGHPYRVGRLISLLRIADAMDMDFRRISDHSSIPGLHELLEPLRADSAKHQRSLAAILGVRIICDLRPSIEVFFNEAELASLQIMRLLAEIESTPMRIPVHAHIVKPSVDRGQFRISGDKSIIFSYFNPSGLITACLSKRNIVRMTDEPELVEIACSQGSTSDVDRFWSSELSIEALIAKEYKYINFCDLPLPNQPHSQAGAIAKLTKIAEMAKVFFGTSFYKDYAHVRKLVPHGVVSVLCDGRTSFVASHPDREDFFWSRVASVLDRDSVELRSVWPQDEIAVADGFVRAFSDVVSLPHGSREGFGLLDLMKDELLSDSARDYFLQYEQLDPGVEKLNGLRGRMKLEGSFIVIDWTHGEATFPGRVLPYYLDKIFEEVNGITDAAEVRNNLLKHPYLIFSRNYDGRPSVLFLSYWKNHKVFPIQLFLPRDHYDAVYGGDHRFWMGFANWDEANARIARILEEAESFLQDSRG